MRRQLWAVTIEYEEAIAVLAEPFASAWEARKVAAVCRLLVPDVAVTVWPVAFDVRAMPG